MVDKKVLIAYGTASGSTEEVAQAIAEEARNTEIEVDVTSVETIKDISGYDGVIVGSAVRMFHIIPKTRRFLRQYRKALEKVPVAYFVVCLAMGEPTPENIEKANKYAEPMVKIKQPVSLGLFGGCIDHEKMTDFFGKSMRALPEQDHRDWDKIRAWGRETIAKLF
jgi:menaquinone-dependent protoporphyrinogen oxidase